MWSSNRGWSSIKGWSSISIITVPIEKVNLDNSMFPYLFLLVACLVFLLLLAEILRGLLCLIDPHTHREHCVKNGEPRDFVCFQRESECLQNGCLMSFSQ